MTREARKKALIDAAKRGNVFAQQYLDSKAKPIITVEQKMAGMLVKKGGLTVGQANEVIDRVKKKEAVTGGVWGADSELYDRHLEGAKVLVAVWALVKFEAFAFVCETPFAGNAGYWNRFGRWLNGAMQSKRSMIIKNEKGGDGMKIGEIKQRLLRAEGKAEVYYDFCHCFPTRINSYRGAPRKPALGWTRDGEIPTVEEILAELALATSVGKTYEGYWGGEYSYNEEHELYVDNDAGSSDTRIRRLELVADKLVIIHTCRGLWCDG